MAQDHLHAKQIAEALMKKDFVKSIMPVETNIAIITTKENYPAKQIAERLYQKGVHVIAISVNQVRFVTHLDISEAMVEKTIRVIEEL